MACHLHIRKTKPNFFIIFLSCWWGWPQRHPHYPQKSFYTEDDALRLLKEVRQPPCHKPGLWRIAGDKPPLDWQKPC